MPVAATQAIQKMQ